MISPQIAKRLKDPRNYTGLIVLATVFGGGALVRQRSAEARTAQQAAPAMSPEFGFRITDMTEAAGLRHRHLSYTVAPKFANVESYVTSIGASVAVFDYDNDGWPDVFFNNSRQGARNTLYRNNHDGTFTDVTGRAGLDFPNKQAVTRAVFLDVDNDGHQDLLLHSACPRLFKGQADGRFVETTSASEFGCALGYGGFNVLDYDGDGFLDLVFAPFYPYELSDENTSRIMPNSFTSASNGYPISVFHNDGKGGFKRVENRLGIAHTAWSHAIGAWDIRWKGRTDLWFSSDFNTDHAYFNDGEARFTAASSDLVPQTHSRSGMNVEIGDVDNDGFPLVFVTQTFNPGQRVTGNALWKWAGGRAFKEIAGERGVGRCGWAWGAKFLDFDNDGKLDLFVGNGMISASRTKDYWYAMSVLDASTGMIVQDSENWPKIGDASLAGYEPACVFLNRGDHFEDINSRTPLAADLSDERGVAVIDFLNDGQQSLVIANQKQDSKLYRFETLNGNSWIGFKLVGTRSNRDAIGAKIRLRLEDRTLTRQVQPFNGYSAQSDSRVHFGLGKAPKILSVSIDWPSQVHQELDPAQLMTGRYQTITEPTGAAR